jgi:hypothetical protein
MINVSRGPEEDFNTLLQEEINRPGPHPPGNNMRDPTGCQQPGQLSRLMPGIEDTFAVKNFLAPDMNYRIAFTVTKM